MYTFCLIAVRKKSLMSVILKNLLSVSGKEMVLVDSEADTIDGFIHEIKDGRIDVVVLEKSCPFADEKVLARLLPLFSSLVVIVVSEDSNWFSVIRREKRLLATSADLIEVITSN